jgi:hypothetical protein
MCPKAVCEDPLCTFAHGGEELRFTDFYFKTSVCMWYSVGKCRNGPSCRFAHGEEELRSIPGVEEDKQQQIKREKGEKKGKNAGNKKEHDQAGMEKPMEAQNLEKKAKANKSKKASQEPAMALKIEQSLQIPGPPGMLETSTYIAPPQQQQTQPLAQTAISQPPAESTTGTHEPMFVQPRQVESSVFSQQPAGSFAMPQFRSRERAAAQVPPMERVDYNGLSQLLSGYHNSNIAQMVEAQQQAALSQLSQFNALTKPNPMAGSGLTLDPGFQGNYPAPPGFSPNDGRSTSWEIKELAEHIKTLGEQVSKLQQCISVAPPKTMKGGHVSETTKSGSSGSFMGMSSSQGSGSSGDDISPPGSPLQESQGRNGHPNALHAEAARLSFALQRIAAAQGANLYPPQ